MPPQIRRAQALLFGGQPDEALTMLGAGGPVTLPHSGAITETSVKTVVA